MCVIFPPWTGQVAGKCGWRRGARHERDRTSRGAGGRRCTRGLCSWVAAVFCQAGAGGRHRRSSAGSLHADANAHQTDVPIEHVDRYLFTVAASVLTDQARRRAVRHESVHDSLEDSHHPAEERTPERVLLDREALDVVVAAISGLPARTRDVFVLHRFEEMTCNRIAAQLGMSISAVEKHIMKALKMLRSRLELD